MGSKAKRVMVGIRLPVALARALKVEAAKRETTTQALAEKAIRAFLKR
jgi:predicted transcriptional regulator